MSTLSLPLALLFGAAWFEWGEFVLATRLLAIASIVVSLATIECTAMIYASLIPIRQWHNRHMLPDYLILGVFSGAVLLMALSGIWIGHPAVIASIAAVTRLSAIAAKVVYWRHNDASTPLAPIAALVVIAGMLVERWLFFGEATHVATLCYGRES